MDDAWACSAAYGYVVHLAPELRAWEYLRRNPHYVRDWMRYRRRATPRIAARWGLAAPVDPHLDARQVVPEWTLGTACPVTLVGGERVNLGAIPEAAEVFSLWNLAGRKSLFHDGSGIRLAMHFTERTVQLRLSGRLCDGDQFAYLIAAADAHRAEYIAFTDYRAPKPVSRAGGAILRERPSRAGIVHVRALQVLDGLAAGASQRQLAVALFGGATTARDWQPDGALRAQVRYLVRKARMLMEEEYWSLVSGELVDSRYRSKIRARS